MKILLSKGERVAGGWQKTAKGGALWIE